MKKLTFFSKGFVTVLALLGLVVGCGGGTPVPGTQFTLNVQGMVTVGDPSNLSLGKAIENPETQVLLGTMIIELQDNFFDEIGVDLDFSVVDFQATAQTDSVGEVQLMITPNTIGSGTFFKKDEFGEPFGANQLQVDTTVVIPESSSGDIMLGQLTFSATNNQEPARLPLLGDLPVLGFQFQNQNKEAEITELVVLLTPALIKVLE